MDSGRVLAAFTAVINRAKLTPRPVAVRARKRPILLDGEACPMIFVAVADEETFEPIGTCERRGYLLWAVKRVASVALAFDQQGRAGDNAGLRAWRDVLWAAFSDGELRGELPELNDLQPAGRPLFDAAAFAGAAFDWSVLTYTVETLEERPD